MPVHAIILEQVKTEHEHACLHVFGHGPPHQAVGQGFQRTAHVVATGANHHDVQVTGGHIQACERTHASRQGQPPVCTCNVTVQHNIQSM